MADNNDSPAAFILKETIEICDGDLLPHEIGEVLVKVKRTLSFLVGNILRTSAMKDSPAAELVVVQQILSATSNVAAAAATLTAPSRVIAPTAQMPNNIIGRA